MMNMNPVEEATSLLTRVEAHVAYSTATREAAMAKLRAAALQPNNSALISLELCRMQLMYEDQLQSANRMASAVAARTLAMVDLLTNDKTEAERTLETERRARQAEKEALQAQVARASAATESTKAMVKKMNTRVMAQSHEHRQLQREMARQQAAFDAHKAQVDEHAATLEQQLRNAQQCQTAMRDKLKALRRQAQDIQLVPQPPAANVEAEADANGREEAAGHAIPRRLEEPNDPPGSEAGAQAERAPVAAPVERMRLPHPVRSTKASVGRQLAIKQKIEDKQKADDAERAKDIATRVIPARVPVPARRARL